MSALYTTEILRLAMTLAQYPRLAAPTGSADRRAALCGSRISVDVITDDDGRLGKIGLAAWACAMGQASAGLLAAAAAGRTAAQISDAREALATWLASPDAPAPEWPGIAALDPARAYPARHGAILLPFDAAAAAMQEAVDFAPRRTGTAG